MRKAVYALSALIIILLFLSFRSNTFAQTATPTPRLRQELRQDVKDFKQEVRDDVKNSGASPSGIRQKLCEDHVGNAKRRILGLGTRGFDMKLRLDKIVTIVENFYTKILLPKGKIVTNYDALVADVAAKKAAMAPLVDKVKADSSVLSCDNGKASTDFQTFKTDGQALISAFKAYRLSVITLVKAVKLAAGEDLSPTPSSEITPEVTQ